VSSTGPEPGQQVGSADDDARLDLARRLVARHFPGASALEGLPPTFALTGGADVRDRFLALQRHLAPLELLPLLRLQAGRPVLRLVPKPPAGQWSWRTNLWLFLATVATTFLSGYMLAQGLAASGYLENAIATGILYSASVLFILGAHEMGHKIVAMRRGIDASLPYFLPMVPLPPLPGTLGAVIMTRTPAPNRDSLMDLGASGPIAGFVAALPVLIYGVTHSFVVKIGDLGDVGYYPDPLLIQGLIKVFLDPPAGTVVLGHPLLWAGWIGLIVTSINLLPAGMLDGGHAVRAALGERAHTVLSYAGMGLAVAMGFYPMAIIIALLIRRGHVGPLDDLSPLSPLRRAIGLSLIVIFVLSAVVFQPFARP
jgi:hypothetical protein